MILNPGNKVAIDLQAWHYWWTWIPVKLTCRDSRGRTNSRLGGWRWLYVVQRKMVYDSYSGEYMWTDYRDLIT